jgi:hypothetical protein
MDNPHGTGWTRHLAAAIGTNVQATVGEHGQMYVLNVDSGEAYHVASVGEDASVYNLMDGTWKHLDAGKRDVACNEAHCNGQFAGSLWAVNQFDEVYKRNGVTETDMFGTSWEKVPGRQRFVSSSEEGIVWAIDPEDDVWILMTGDISTRLYVDNIEHGWTLIENYAGNTLIQVDSGYNSQLVGVNAEGDAFFRTGIVKALPKGDGWSNVFNQ